jgi:hypothetical protein
LDIEKTRQAILTPLDPKPAPAAAVTPSASLPKPRDEVVDTHKLYDVYCAERNQEVVVYRNAIIKGTKCLPKGGEDDAPFEFLEIQQADGKSVFVSKSSVIKFCERGVTPRSEKVPGGQA